MKKVKQKKPFVSREEGAKLRTTRKRLSRKQKDEIVEARMLEDKDWIIQCSLGKEGSV